MELTITLEIEIPVTFDATKGYPATRYEPGEPDDITDIDFKMEDVKKAVNQAIDEGMEDGWLYDELLEEAANDALSDQLAKEDYFFECWKDQQRGLE